MFIQVTLSLLEGFMMTLELFALTLLFSLPLGMVVCLAGMGRFAPLRWFVHGAVWVIRGTPLMLQIMVVFYGPGLMFGWGYLPRMTAALVAFSVNYACYFAEIYRGGILAVPVGQQEAGLVLGMSRVQIFFRITLMQVIKRIMPTMSNEVITLVKDTSLVRVIAVTEVMFKGEAYLKQGMIWPLFYTGVFYLVFSGILTLGLNKVEKKLEYFR